MRPTPPVSNYFLQTSRAGGAGQSLTVKSAALVDYSADVLRADRLDRSGDLVDVLTIIPILVRVVVAVVGPLQFTHRKLRGETEGAFTDVALRNQTLEALPGDHKQDLVRSYNVADPVRVAALAVTVRDSGLDNRLDDRDRPVSVDSACAERLLVDTEGKATVAHELVAGDAVFTKLEAAGGQIEQVFLDVCVVTENFDLISGSKNLEELTVFVSKRLGKHLFTKEDTKLVERLEVHRAVRLTAYSREPSVDLLHVASQVGRERLRGVADILDTGLNKELITDVGVDDLENCLLEGHLSLQVAAFEGGTGSLNVDTRSSATKRLKLIEVFSGSNNIVVENTTDRWVVVAVRPRSCVEHVALRDTSAPSGTSVRKETVTI